MADFSSSLRNGLAGYMPSRPDARPKALGSSPPPPTGPTDSFVLSKHAPQAPSLESRLAEFWSTAFPQMDSVANETFVAVAARNLATLAWETIRKTFPETVSEDGVNGLLQLLRALSPHSAAHSKRVGDLALGLAQELQMSEEEQKQLELSAQFKELGMIAIDLLSYTPEEREALGEDFLKCAGDVHDIGKLKVPPGILDKAGPLDDQEWALVKLHPVVGEYMLEGIPELRAILPAVRGHHERFDGEGYPDHREGLEIPLSARVLALADSYDAMTEVRPYRRPYTASEAFQEILNAAGSQFDPSLAGLFLRMVASR